MLGDSDGVVVLRPKLGEKLVQQAEEHSSRPRQANTKKVPYHEQMDSEEKVRAYENVIWKAKR